MRVARYIRQHHLAMIALFIALTGTAYAGTQVANQPGTRTLKAKKKKAVRGPAGPQGPAGSPGPAGSSAPGLFLGRSSWVQTVTDSYATPVGSSGFNTVASNADVVSPAQGTVLARDLQVSVAADTNGYVLHFALAVNGVDSALQCTIPGGPANSGCSDTADAVTIPAGSTIVLHESHSTSGGSPALQPYRFGWRASTP